MRKSYPPSFKAKVALEAIKEQKTSAELASQYQVHPGQIRNWKAIAQKGLINLFSDKHKGKHEDWNWSDTGTKTPYQFFHYNADWSDPKEWVKMKL